MRTAEQMPLRSRIAPTPSGYLHLGNAVNFVITWVLVRQAGGVLRLRIDDADGARCRPQYVEDIFRQLEWLGLDWDEGPQGPDQYHQLFSQRLRFDRYRALLGELRRGGHTYCCSCSRARIRARVGNGVYPGLCRGQGQRPGLLVERVLVPEETMIEVGTEKVALAESLGDFVLWRRDDTPAYQLASLGDDLQDRINFIVRGADLLVSSAAQIFLAKLLGEESFGRICFVHHDLVAGSDGLKLSKSDRALSLESMRRQGMTPLNVYQATAPFLGLQRQQVGDLADLRQLGFRRIQY